MLDVGDARLRICDRVDRSFRRILCGMNEGIVEMSFEAVVVTSRNGA